VPAGRTHFGATHPIRHPQALKKHRRRVGWGAETSGREGSWLGQTGAGGAVHRAMGGVRGGSVSDPTLTPRAVRRRPSLIPLNTTWSFRFRGLFASAGVHRTGPAAPLRADTRSRVGGSAKTGSPSGDIPRSPGPVLGSRDRPRYVPEASTRCRVAGEAPPAWAPLALRFASTRSLPPCRPRAPFGSDIHCRDCAPCVFSLARISLGVCTTLIPRARGVAHLRTVAIRHPLSRTRLRFSRFWLPGLWLAWLRLSRSWLPRLRLSRLLIHGYHLLSTCRRSSLPAIPAVFA